jgi:hypothetical protein
MPDERFLIQIIVDAQSKVAPVMKSISDAADGMAARMKLADTTVRQLDTHMEQLDNHVEKARNTMRSMNPTLEALDNKLKGVSEKTTVINRNFGVLERQSGKLTAGFKALNNVIDGLERKLNQLDNKMVEMGAKKYRPEIDVQTSKSEARVDALVKKLISATRGVHTAKTDVEIGLAEQKVASLRRDLEELGHGGLAHDIIVDISDAAYRTTQAKLDNLSRRADEAARNRDIKLTLAGEEHIKAQIAELVAEADLLSKKDVGLRASFNMVSFRRQYAEIQTRIDLLAARSPHIRVQIDADRSTFQRILESVDSVAERADLRFSGLSTKLRDIAIGAAIVFAEPLLSAFTALGGALIAVGVAAGQAAAGIAGFAVAGAAQAVPVVGILVATFSRLAGVMKAVQAAQAQKDQGTLQGARADNTQANALDALKNAHQGVLDAMRQLVLAQQNLNDARRQGIRDLTDLRLEEERANLTAQKSQFALAAQIGSGSGGLIQDAQLQSRSDSITARRQTIDTTRAVAGGVNGLPSVQAAQRAVDDAQRSLDRAKDSVVAAQRAFDTAAQNQGAAANALAVALGKLTGAEKTLYESVRNFQALFQNGGAFTKVTDLMVAAFARGLDKITKLLKDPEILAAATGLSRAMASSFNSFIDFFTKGPMRRAIIFFAGEASKNLKPFTDILESIITILTDIGKAASGPFHDALVAVEDFFGGIAKYTSSDKGQSALAKFFHDSLAPMASFLKLGGAVLELFLALVGVGVGKEGTRGIDGLTKSVQNATKYVQENGDKVRTFFHDAIDASGSVLRLLVKIAGAIVQTFDSKSVSDFADTLGNSILPALVAFVKGIGFATNALVDLINTPVGSFFTQVSLFLLGAFFVGSKLVGLFANLVKFFLLAGGGLGKLISSFAETSVGSKIASAFNPGVKAAGRLLSAMGELIGKIPGLGKLGDAIRSVGERWKKTGDQAKVAVEEQRIASEARGGVILPSSATRGRGSLAAKEEEEAAARRGITKGRAVGGAAAVAAGLYVANSSAGDSLADAGRMNLLDKVSAGLKDIAGSALSLDLKGVFSDIFRNSDKFSEFASDATDKLKALIDSKNVEGLRKISDQASNYARHFPQFADQLSKFSDAATSAIHDINAANLKRSEDNIKSYGRTLDAVTTDTKNHFKQMAEDSKGSLSDIRKATVENTGIIKLRLGADTAAGKEALASNYRQAAAAVQDSMDAGVVSTKSGLAEIRRLMVKALVATGMSEQDAQSLSDHGVRERSAGTGSAQGGGGAARATGGFMGWVGKQGERGADAVHAVLGRGEAVLNWAHQRVVEPALNAMYGFGLDGLFKGTRALHAGQGSAYQNTSPGGVAAYAGGGPAGGNTIPTQVPLTGVHAGVIAAARKIINMFPGLIVTSGTGGTHATNSYHYKGDALDIGGSVAVMNRAASWIRSNIGSRLTEGIHNPNLSISNGKSVSPSFWGAETWAAHANHIHIAILGALGKAFGSISDSPTIKRVKTQTKGVLGQVIQGALDANTAAARAQLKKATGDGGSADTSDFQSASFKGPWVARMAQIAKDQGWDLADWKQLVQGESGGNPNARNSSSGAYGLGQFLGGTLRAYAKFGATSSDGVKQIEAMAKYIADRYHDPSNALHQWLSRSPHWYAGGGRVGGAVSKFAGWFANGTDRIVNKPTLFGAGEAGAERVTITPMAAGAPSAVGSFRQTGRGSAGYSSSDAAKLLSQALAATGIDDVVGGVQAFIKALRTFNTRTSAGLAKVGKLLDFATTDGTSSVQKIIDATEAHVDRRNAIGLDPLGTAVGETSGLRSAQRALNSETAIARAGLTRANRTGDTKNRQLFQGELNKLDVARTDLLSRLRDNASNIVDGITGLYDRIQKHLTNRQDINAAQGKDADPGLITQQIGFSLLEQRELMIKLAKAKKTNNTQLAQSIQDKIDDLDVSVAQLVQQRLQVQLDNVNSKYENLNASADRQFAVGTTLGVAGTSTAKIDRQAFLATQQVGDLQGVLAQARAANNPKMVADIQAQIETLNNSLVEFASNRIKAIVDDINTQAERDLAHNDVRQRLANLGVTQDQARNGGINIAALGRPDYGAIGSALQDRGGILASQRSALLGQLAAAQGLGDQGEIADLTRQIETLDGDVVDNIKAIRDNTDAAFNAAVTQSQAGSDFMLSLNQGAQQISTGIGALTGTTDVATQGALLRQRGTELQGASSSNRGFLGSLLSGTGVDTSQLGSVSGNALVPYLTQLYQQGIASGKLDDTQIQSLKDLITAIIGNETALLDNTKAINDLNGSVAQTFSSTAWTTFRQAIFNGGGGLLPEYSIPQMHVGGYVTKAGLFDLSPGERVLTPEQQQSGNSGLTIEEQNINITNPTETLDERYIGTKVGWAMVGSGRS